MSNLLKEGGPVTAGEPVRLSETRRSWWEQLPSDVRLAAHLVAFTVIVSAGVGAVMGAWLLWVLARA